MGILFILELVGGILSLVVVGIDVIAIKITIDVCQQSYAPVVAIHAHGPIDHHLVGSLDVFRGEFRMCLYEDLTSPLEYVLVLDCLNDPP